MRKHHQAPTPVVGQTPHGPALNWQRRASCSKLGDSSIHSHTGSRGSRLTLPEPDLHHQQPSPAHPRAVLPTMSYGKKDEDGDSALVKIDRTQVFQDCLLYTSPSPRDS